MKTTDDNFEQLLALLQTAKPEDSQQLLAKTLPQLIAVLHDDLKKTNRRLLWLTVAVVVMAILGIGPRLFPLIYLAGWRP